MPTHGLGVALLERLWVLDLAYRDCLYLFRGQDTKLDRARSLDRPRDTQKVGQPRDRFRVGEGWDQRWGSRGRGRDALGRVSKLVSQHDVPVLLASALAGGVGREEWRRVGGWARRDETRRRGTARERAGERRERESSWMSVRACTAVLSRPEQLCVAVERERETRLVLASSSFRLDSTRSFALRG